MKEAIKIKLGEEIRSIRGLGFDQGPSWVQLGDNTSLGAYWGTANNGGQLWRWRKEFEGEKYCMNPVHQLCLSLNMTGGTQIRAPSPPELHHIPLLFLSLPLGPTETEDPSSSLLPVISPLLADF
jgi:hypothetical protein